MAHGFAFKGYCIIRSVSFAAKISLPTGKAGAFEAAGKQGYDCMAWSRKRRAGFISRQGVYESPVPHTTPDFGTKCLELVGICPQKSKWAGSYFRVFPP